MSESRTRRRHPRGTLNGVAQLSGRFGRATGELSELSVGGAFVANVNVRGGALEPGPSTPVRLHLLLPGSALPVEVPSVVLYRRERSAQSPPGIGLRFCDLEREDARRLEAAVLDADARMTRLLFRLQMTTLTRDDLDRAAIEAGIPAGLRREEVERRVEEAIRRFRGG